jgi:hypothetical protein
MKTVPLNEAPTRLNEIFDDAQSGSPVLLVRNGEVAKLEKVEPPTFGGDSQLIEEMLLQAVRSEHREWTPEDLNDIARRVRERRGK